VRRRALLKQTTKQRRLAHPSLTAHENHPALTASRISNRARQYGAFPFSLQ
jgi:hypothetical protein